MIGGHTSDGMASQVDIYEDHLWRQVGHVHSSDRVGFAIQPFGSERLRLIGGVRPPEERLADGDIPLPPRFVPQSLVQPVEESELIEVHDEDDQRVVSRRSKRVLPRGPAAKQLAEDAYRALAAGRLNDAREILTDCVARFPSAAQCHRLLGSVYAEIDDTRESIMHYKMYLKLKPNAPDADRVRSLIKSAESNATPM